MSPSTKQRVVKPLSTNCAQEYPNNTVVNSRYTPLNFLPKNLFEQFRRPLNAYFLLVALLQFISIVAPVNPLSTLLPLVFVFALTAAKEGHDDLQRHRQDRLYNNRQFCVLRGAMWEEGVRSSALRVGDVVRLRQGMEIPADAVLVASTSTTRGGKEHCCYVRTDNMDGELDLKEKAVPHGLPRLADVEDVAAVQALLGRLTLVCPPPSEVVNSFDARIELRSEDGTDEMISLSAQNLLMQSCSLQRTETVVAVIVYTGPDTKCGMNKQDAPQKWSQMDQRVSHYSKRVFAMQMAIAVVFGALGSTIDSSVSPTHWYLAREADAMRLRWLIVPVRFFLLTSVMIPISFKFAVDVSKYFLSLVLQWDVQMVDASNGVGMVVNNSGIAEDLGQVQFIMTDKTGTLTDNVMEFKACCTADGTAHWHDNPTASTNASVQQLSLAVALCNGLEVKQDAVTGHTTYHGTSPDEEALVLGMAQFGARLTAKEGDRVVIQTGSGTDTCAYIVLDVLEFASDRRCMSVLVQNVATGLVQLITKGADDRLLAMADPSRGDTKYLADAVKRFAEDGFRTLVLGIRTVAPPEKDEYLRAVQHVMVSCGVDRAAALAPLHAKMEQGLHLIGATAIEDKLQDGVPATLAKLQVAGVRVWMLTGDKLETAWQVAMLSGLVSPEVHRIDVVDVASLEEATENARASSDTMHQTAVVLSGPALETFSAHDQKTFLALALRCSAVVCARVAPIQKALLTTLVRDSRPQCVTLAVGDGGNDVAMIQAAHVGVGIDSKEGKQAARASDFSIGRFRFLLPLLLVHGQYSYQRTSYIVEYSFYKSMLISLIQVSFNAVALWSGASYWNSYFLMMWNGVFTLPPTLFYVLDRWAPREALEAFPSLYRHSQAGEGMNAMSFAWALARGQAQSVIGLWLTLRCIGEDAATGVSYTVTYTAFVFLQLFVVAMESHSITALNALVLVAMPAHYVVTTGVFASARRTPYYGVWQRATQSSAAALTCTLLLAVLALPPFVIRAVQQFRTVHPRIAATLWQRQRTRGVSPDVRVIVSGKGIKHGRGDGVESATEMASVKGAV